MSWAANGALALVVLGCLLVAFLGPRAPLVRAREAEGWATLLAGLLVASGAALVLLAMGVAAAWGAG